MRFFLLVVLFVSTIGLHAQTIVKGVVLDAETQQPLIGVNIKTSGFKEDQGTVTDINGQYELGLNDGTQTMTFSYIGYETLTKDIVGDGSMMTLDVQMKPGAELGVVVVTDGKYERNLENSAVSIDVLTSSQLKTQNLSSLDLIVQKVSGVQMVDGQASIRSGAGWANGIGSRVMFVIDGQPMLGAELANVSWNFVPVENMAQVEVVKGASSVLYGSGALNGVINVRTAYATDVPHTSFTLYGGVYDQPASEANRWSKGRPFGEQPIQNGLMFSHRRRVGKYFDLVVGGNLHYEKMPQEGLAERRARMTFNTTYRLPGTEGRVSMGVNGSFMHWQTGQYFLWRDYAQGGAYRNFQSDATPDFYTLTNIDPWLTAYSKNGLKHDLRLRWFNVTKQREPFQNSVANLYSAQYNLQKNFEEQELILTVGAQGQHMYANSVLFNNNATNPQGVALFKAWSGAAFAQAEKTFFKKLTVTAGLRWEFFQFDTITALAPPIFRGGLNYQMGKNYYLRASAGQGYRFPALGERFISEQLSSLLNIFPNPQLQPEQGWNAELGLKKTFRNNQWKGYADLAIFAMEYNNMVEFAFNMYNVNGADQLGFKTVNTAKARIAGLELSGQLEGKVGNVGLRFFGGYTYSFPGDLTTNPAQSDWGTYLGNAVRGMTSRPDSTLGTSILRYRTLHNVRLDVEAGYRGFTFGVAANYNSATVRVDDLFMKRGTYGPLLDLVGIPLGLDKYLADHADGDWIFDFRLGYAVSPKGQLTFNVQNATNREWAMRPGRMNPTRLFSVKYQHTF